MLLLVLAVLALGAVLGAAGMRRLGRVVGRATGPWRSALGGLAAVAMIGGLALLARGAVLEGALLMLLSFGLAGGARLRRPKPSPTREGMSETEARSVLGVSPTAGAEEIEAAYRRLIRRVHPDAGGAAGLAAQLNRARDRLKTSAGRG